jgi:hypothetical protein
VSTNAEQQTQVHTKGPDVGTSFARDPKDRQLSVIVELEKFAFVNGPYSQLSLDSRNEWWSLEKRAGQRFDGASQLCLAAGQLLM